MMKPFRFQQFNVSQSKEVFRVGTDAVLLGALANVSGFRNILEIGTGTGIVSLMLAQRNPTAKVTALDIDENAAELAANNFENSIFSERISAVHCDFKNYRSAKKFDLIISNPPYFPENDSAKNKIARQTVELNFFDLIKNAAALLSENGMFTVIIPAVFSQSFIKNCEDFALHLSRKIDIRGIENGDIKRNILEFSFNKNKTHTENFTIEKSPRIYSEEYLALTKDFHVFG